MNCSPHIKWLPVVLALFIPISFFITYWIAVTQNHVSTVWPYISDTGTTAPENCVFGELLNIATGLLCVCVFIKHKQCTLFNTLRLSSKVSPCLNNTGLAFGLLACLGLSLVANFQETHVIVVHFFGFFMVCIFGNLYFIMQTWFTYTVKYGPKFLLWTRVCLSLAMIVFTVTTMAPLKGAMDHFNGDNPRMWKPEHGGYALHLISSFSEWFLVFSYCGFISTFYWEFQNVNVKLPPVKLTDKAIEKNLEGGKAGNFNASFRNSEVNLSVSHWI